MGISGSVPEKSIHEFTVKDSRGKDVELSIYQGKVLLVVNVASKCGFTDTNYTQLTDLYKKYKDQGFEILAFPCNQFLNQEPGTSEEAQEFACTRYKAEYPIFQKFSQTWYFIWGLGYFDDSISLLTDDTSLLHRIGLVRVNGKQAAPLYKFLKTYKNGFMGSRIKWNFTKFLISKEGQVVGRFGPTVSPLSMETHIKKELGDQE